MPSNFHHETKHITTSLLAIPSVSPSVDDENRCADKIAELLLAPFLDSTNAPELSPIFWSATDGRNNVACLLESRHPQNSGATIILMGHFDTVGVDDFIALGKSARVADPARLAFAPDELARVLANVLAEKNRNDELTELEQSAFAALQSGQWMFGRGSVDMKSGLASIMSVLREFARPQKDGTRLIDSLRGNLLLLACPDEETESVGILSALEKLIQLRAEKKLNYLGVINADYTAPRDADESARYVYSGTVGKLLPSFYILGVRTHVGEIFRGVDAAHIAAELVSEISLAPEWMDDWHGEVGGQLVREVAVPPVALHMRDLKTSYNVETAGEALVYVNWLTLTRTPTQAMTLMRTAAESALQRVGARRDAAHSGFSSLGGQAPRPPMWSAAVVEYAQLVARVRSGWDESAPASGVSFESWLENRAREISMTVKDGREFSQRLVAEVASLSGLSGPAIILFFGPPYYPSMAPQSNALTGALAKVLPHIPAPIQLRGFYPYISDLSYAGIDAGVDVRDIARNLPLMDLTDSHGAPFSALTSGHLEAVRQLGCAVINIGPFGRDAHGMYERVHMPYSFGIAPQIIFETIQHALG